MARILIVDDEIAILRCFGLVLESAGHEVTTAISADDAKQKLMGQSFEVLITDVRMETPTAGFEVLREARRNSPKMPVALLTAFPLPTAEWKQAGADALFQKGGSIIKPMIEWVEAVLDAKKTAGDPSLEPHLAATLSS